MKAIPKKRVLIVDDHDIVRRGLGAMLREHARFDLVGEAADGEEACRLAATHLPDIVVMDISMPVLNGAEATRRILVRSPTSHVIILTVHEEPAYVRELLTAGARGYVLKRAPFQTLVRAIEVVADGGVFLDPGLASRPQGPTAAMIGDPSADLSAREIDVGSLAASGYSNAAIAAALKISAKTVETHKARLMSKLGLRTRAQLVRYAIQRGWLRP